MLTNGRGSVSDDENMEPRSVRHRRGRPKVVRSLMLAVMLSVTPLVAFAGPASAAPAPSCVHAKNEGHFWTNHVHVANRCRSWQRVKVILRYYPDGGCVQLAPGRSFTHSHKAGKFDGLRRC